jgi:hypothetical protein
MRVSQAKTKPFLPISSINNQGKQKYWCLGIRHERGKGKKLSVILKKGNRVEEEEG